MTDEQIIDRLTEELSYQATATTRRADARKAPYGDNIFEGDRVQHDGRVGLVAVDHDYEDETNMWRVDFGDEVVRLCTIANEVTL